jgi:transposase
MAGKRQAQNRNANRKRKKKGMCLQDRPLLEPKAAGIDIGAREIWVAVPPGLCEHPVRVFHSFTEDLESLAQWLVSLGIRTAAMESTGVYWIPLYEILEARGVKPCLVNARHMKNVPGRRTDWHDCQWLQYLHSVGLLRPAFRPDDQICAVRAIQRHRGELVEMAGEHILHMQKALTQMNVQLHHVINDITGLTGLAIVDAILGGQRDPEQLAKLRHYRIQADEETIRKSLVGNWRREHLFALKQSREFYRFYQEQIEQCDRETQSLLGAFQAWVDPGAKPLPPDGKKRRQRSGRNPGGKDQQKFDMRTEMYKLFGVDVLQIPGLEGMTTTLFAEVGRDLSKFASASHFVSWLGLCPDNDKSGGKCWRAARPVKNRAGQLFRMAAYPLHRSMTPLGQYLRRMKAKLGPAGATMATARKIAVIFYTMVTRQVEYDETIWVQQDAARQKRIEQNLRRQAKQFGYDLVPATT